MGNGDLREKSRIDVDVGFCDVLAQASNLSDLFEKKDFSRFITIDTDASGVVSTIFKPLETIAKNIADGPAVLLNQKVAVGEDATHVVGSEHLQRRI